VGREGGDVSILPPKKSFPPFTREWLEEVAKNEPDCDITAGVHSELREGGDVNTVMTYALFVGGPCSGMRRILENAPQTYTVQERSGEVVEPATYERVIVLGHIFMVTPEYKKLLNALVKQFFDGFPEVEEAT
jgi:hypothetical protein